MGMRDKVAFQFQLTVNGVGKSWRQMKSRASTSCDTLGINNRMVDICMQSYNFKFQLTRLFNMYISRENLPQLLKVSKVVPIPKTKQVSSPNDLRPISIQPVLAKLFGKLLFDQLYVYLESNEMLSRYQFGGRKCHSTTHALIVLTDFIYESLENNNVCIFVSCDIRKAYDFSCKEVLKHKLKWYGVSSELIISFLSGRKQYVCMCCKDKQKISQTLSTNLGVSQGLCLSCLLFLIMMNDLTLHIKNCLCAMFVDDTGLIISGKIEDIQNVVKLMEEDLNSVSKWMKSSRQELNVDKCVMMVVSKKNAKPVLENVIVKINGVPLKRVQSKC